MPHNIISEEELLSEARSQIAGDSWVEYFIVQTTAAPWDSIPRGPSRTIEVGLWPSLTARDSSEGQTAAPSLKG